MLEAQSACIGGESAERIPVEVIARLILPKKVFQAGVAEVSAEVSREIVG